MFSLRQDDLLTDRVRDRAGIGVLIGWAEHITVQIDCLHVSSRGGCQLKTYTHAEKTHQLQKRDKKGQQKKALLHCGNIYAHII